MSLSPSPSPSPYRHLAIVVVVVVVVIVVLETFVNRITNKQTDTISLEWGIPLRGFITFHVIVRVSSFTVAISLFRECSCLLLLLLILFSSVCVCVCCCRNAFSANSGWYHSYPALKINGWMTPMTITIFTKIMMAKAKQNCHFTSLLSVWCVFILGSTIIPFQLILFVRVGHEQAMRGKKKKWIYTHRTTHGIWFSFFGARRFAASLAFHVHLESCRIFP